MIDVTEKIGSEEVLKVRAIGARLNHLELNIER